MCMCACVRKEPVNKSYYDVLDVDVLVKFGTRSEERVQGLEVELVWENLRRKSKVVGLCVSAPTHTQLSL